MNLCPKCKTVMKTTELYDVYQCPSCNLTVTTEDTKNIYNYCKDCGVRLGRVQHKRRKPAVCYDCRGERISSNPALKQVYEELSKKNREQDPLEQSKNAFEDDPRALKEVEKGRVVRIPTQLYKGGVDFD